MHSVEIVLQGDSTSAVIVEESKRGSSIDCLDNSCRDHVDRDSINSSEGVANEMSSKGQPSMQQAATITKAPLIVAANKAKNGLNNTLAKLNTGEKYI